MRCCPHCRAIFNARLDFCGLDGARLVERDDDPMVGTDIDEYRVLERIGMGMSGVVYRVVHRTLERVDAVKVLFGELAQNKKISKRFQREARAMAQIDHPNILQVIDFGTTEGGLPYMVMEHLVGMTLRELIDREAPFAFGRVAVLGAQIASGLAEVHRRGYVHRDVKPSNMMVSREAWRERLRILDFGVVGFADPMSLDTQITAAGQILGTPIYMAPEQARDPREVGPPADVYSLGVLLYEMIAGVPPFDGHEIADVLVKHALEVPRSLPPCEGMEALIPWMLEKNPAIRPSSFELEQEFLSIAYGLQDTDPALAY